MTSWENVNFLLFFVLHVIKNKTLWLLIHKHSYNKLIESHNTILSGDKQDKTTPHYLPPLMCKYSIITVITLGRIFIWIWHIKDYQTKHCGFWGTNTSTINSLKPTTPFFQGMNKISLDLTISPHSFFLIWHIKDHQFTNLVNKEVSQWPIMYTLTQEKRLFVCQFGFK